MEAINKTKLGIDSYYTQSEINEIGMKPLNNHKMGYEIYEMDTRVYFFERVSKHYYRLFSITSRQSFYLA